MTEKLQQTIKEEIEKLPKEAQEAIRSVDWVKITEEMGNAHQLGNEKIEDLQLETLLVLVSAEDVESYAINIEKQAEIVREEAEKIAAEARLLIFRPIYRTLTENIKNKIKDKKINWKQSLNFILSGGDYAAFLDSPSKEENYKAKP